MLKETPHGHTGVGRVRLFKLMREQEPGSVSDAKLKAVSACSVTLVKFNAIVVHSVNPNQSCR